MADGEVVISGRDGTAARVAADGRLRIGAAEVSLSDGQRAQFVAYYGAARAVYRHAASTGMAGALLGVTAATGVATGVATGIAKGDLSDLNAKIEAQADEVKREALKICDSLGELRSVQDALAAELPAFTPYAVVSVRETRDCGKDLKKGPGG